MKETENIWNNPLSRLHYNGQDYKGQLYYNGIEFTATLNYQTSGKYVMRGRVSAISPATGRVLTVPAQTAGDASKSSAQKRATAEIYADGTDETSAKATIQSGAIKLFRKYALAISRELQIAARPNTIIPSVAAILYADSYIVQTHKGLKESTAKKYAEEIRQFYCKLPLIPMAQVKAKAIQNELKRQNIGRDRANRLYNFWQYLLDCRHVDGVNPFPLPEKRKVSATSKQMRLKRIDELTLPQQDLLFHKIMGKERVHGGDCGIALYLWGGFTVDDKKTWGSFNIRDANTGLAVMAHRRDDLSGATHIFDRPLFPQAVQILSRAKTQLLEKYTNSQLKQMPIISTVKNPAKAMDTTNLYQYAGKLLREIGIKEADFARIKNSETSSVAKKIFLNTYKKNLYLRIGLDWDEGALQYLQGLSLQGNVTNDNYTSYSDDDAIKRMHTAMMSIQPDRPISSQDVIMQDIGSGKSIIVSPQRTRKRAGVVSSIILPPGAKLRISCRHGVTGELHAREMLPDGQKRRASPKRRTN